MPLLARAGQGLLRPVCGITSRTLPKGDAECPLPAHRSESSGTLSKHGSDIIASKGDLEDGALSSDETSSDETFRDGEPFDCRRSIL